jgi:hypothetical protein
MPQQGSHGQVTEDSASADVPTGVRKSVFKRRFHQRIWKELLVMDFDMMADKHPILIDLMGICACMTHASREGRQVALGYIKNILKRESIPIDGILPEFANILAINYETYEGAKA